MEASQRRGIPALRADLACPGWLGMVGLAHHGLAGVAWLGWRGVAGLARPCWADPGWKNWPSMVNLLSQALLLEPPIAFRNWNGKDRKRSGFGTDLERKYNEKGTKRNGIGAE